MKLTIHDDKNKEEHLQTLEELGQIRGALYYLTKNKQRATILYVGENNIIVFKEKDIYPLTIDYYLNWFVEEEVSPETFDLELFVKRKNRC